jgi:transcriptional regulator with XRE-family HTH domain
MNIRTGNRPSRKKGAHSLAPPEMAQNRPTKRLKLFTRGKSFLPEQHIVLGDYYRARRAFDSDAQLARVLGVHRSRISAWKKGKLPDREHARLLATLGIVVNELAEFMDSEVICDWLTAPQIEIGGREPADLLREGSLIEVLQLANATEYGAYV